MIFISAGHYPERPGACFGEFCEHGEAVHWVNEITSMIDTDIVIVPTGTLREKCRYINNYDTGGQGSLCAEVHFNSAMKDGKHVGTGAETLFMPDSQRGAYLAAEIQAALVDGGLFADRGIKEGWYRLDRRNGPNYFLQKTRYPAVIIEPEFIHHSADILIKRFDGCARIAGVLSDVHRELNNARTRL